MNPTEIKKLIETQNVKELRKLLRSGVLEIVDRKIQFKDKKQAEDQEKYWDKRQQVSKILLNSLYGALLNSGCRFFDKRIGQSTTLTGRRIDKHMAAKINEIITGEYNHVGKSVIYCDSVTGDTKILTETGDVTIEALFNSCADHSTIGDKEYGVWCPSKVAGFNSYEDSASMSKISYVMRHKTKKKLYKINLKNGKNITVTEDHSVMVDRDGFLIEVKPTDILDTDLFICLSR